MIAGLLAILMSLALLIGGAEPVAADETPVETFFPAILPGPARTTLRIVSSTDLVGVRPLIGSFQLEFPGTAIRYTEFQSSWEMYLFLDEACRHRRDIVDLSLSSAVDLQVKLTNDGCALHHEGPDTGALPAWARWRGEVFGLTFEPAVILYAKRDFPDGDPPRNRFELIDLLRQYPERFRGRVATYDIVTTGVGYLFNALDYQQGGTYGRLLESLGRSEVKLLCCTSRMIEGLENGSLALGYNALGSYALARMEKRDDIGIILPSDYTLVMSRAAFVYRYAGAAAAAGSFIDYALSPGGRAALSRESRLLSAIDGEEALLAMPMFATIGRSQLRPIELAPRLMAGQDQVRRRRLLSEWSRTLHPPLPVD